MELSKPIGALWKKTSARGTDFLSGKIGDQEVVIFKNKYYNPDAAKVQPYFNVYASEKKQQAKPAMSYRDSSNDAPVYREEEREIEVKDIPF